LENFIEGLSVYLHGSFILAYAAAYLGGVLMSFTPCVYPMIPITIAFIGAHSSGSKVKGLLLSIVYVLGMSVTYTALAATAALTGKLFGQIQANPWTNFFVANICILMGLSMLDVFVLPIRVPGFLAKAQPKRNGIAFSSELYRD
jgi:thiol:disulfide interchange protein DsbD